MQQKYGYVIPSDDSFTVEHGHQIINLDDSLMKTNFSIALKNQKATSNDINTTKEMNTSFMTQSDMNQKSSYLEHHLTCPYASQFSCLHCKKSSTSVLQSETGRGTWLACFIIFCFGCYPCCLCPFCIDNCKDKIHSCPNCGNVVGKRAFLLQED